MDERENLLILFLGDLNGWVGNEDKGFEKAVGQREKKQYKKNGQRIIELCIENDLWIAAIKFRHKNTEVYERRITATPSPQTKLHSFSIHLLSPPSLLRRIIYEETAVFVYKRISRRHLSPIGHRLLNPTRLLCVLAETLVSVYLRPGRPTPSPEAWDALLDRHL